MKPYDNQREYIRWYFAHYRHAIVVRGQIPYEWMMQNLEETFHSVGEDCMGQKYPKVGIGYGILGVTDRRDENFYLFYDQDHVRQIVEAMPEIIVTSDPFGPDVCQKCGGFANPSAPLVAVAPALSGWRLAIARLLGIAVP